GRPVGALVSRGRAAPSCGAHARPRRLAQSPQLKAPPMRRTSIILLSVASALLAFILLFERGSLSTSEREGRKGRVLDSFVRERVTRIEVQRRGVTTVLAHVAPDPGDPLDAGGGRVEQPYQGKADRDTVDSLISALEWIE